MSVNEAAAALASIVTGEINVIIIVIITTTTTTIIIIIIIIITATEINAFAAGLYLEELMARSVTGEEGYKSFVYKRFMVLFFMNFAVLVSLVR